MSATDIPVLPELREDLQLLPGPELRDGSPSWNIYDSVRNRYYRIGWKAFQLLSRWSSGTVDALRQRVMSETTYHPDDKDISAMIEFLFANSLTREAPSGNSSDYVTQYNSGNKHWIFWLVQNYLFIRIPLVRPHRFLKATLPWVECVYSQAFRNSLLVMFLIGVFLVIRQWSEFSNSFLYFFNAKGMAFYVLALIFIKILHELGHAYTATRYHCKVPTMGVALLVMFPILYTDTSDAWRLRSRKERLWIGAAGMSVEISVAIIATLLWSFLPDGILRSAMFILATTGWIMSVVVNLNPFMRFDGYYLLSDWLSFENLQQRSFALGKWKLRQVLFGLKHPAPEPMAKPLRRNLIIYAWITWCYRLMLFLGIAFLVYHLFIKLLGIFLFLVEIFWFILLPIAKEMKVWWQMRAEIIQRPQFYLSLTIVSILLILFFVPWNTRIGIPAVIEYQTQTEVYASDNGRVTTVNLQNGKSVKQGDLLLLLESPEIEQQQTQLRLQIQADEILLNRRAASEEDRANQSIIRRSLEEKRSQLQALQEKQGLLELRAPVDGVLLDIDQGLAVGQWLQRDQAVASIVQADALQLQGRLVETELDRIEVGQKGVFLPFEPELKRFPVVVTEIEYASQNIIDEEMLLSDFGGEIAARKDADGKYVAENSVYRIHFSVDAKDAQELNIGHRRLKGIVQLEGYKKSFYEHLKEGVLAVLIRESGF